ncbi:MAG TPA: double zinc ribbon domain-containing protein [Candidatus Binatia bacterium]|nr:double zinc ribbon domain-containing protein [Candidatus Binatia bacterium]
MLEVLLSVLYPPTCALCRRELRRARANGLCGACESRLEAARPGCPRCAEPSASRVCKRCRAAPPAFSSVAACLAYRTEDPDCAVRRAVARWKYDGDLAVGRALARTFGAWCALRDGAFDAVVPVPLERARLAARGFNQAAVLAYAAARARRSTVVHGLRRRAFEESQTALGRGARRENVAGRFAVGRRAPVAGLALVLVDDVLTTGATADECAGALLAAGARSVAVWTLARAGQFFAEERPLP